VTPHAVLLSPLAEDQGDQIGRIFDILAIFYHRAFL
jgi:hypothetical protein